MTVQRVRIKWPAVHGLLKSPEVAALVRETTKRIDAQAQAHDLGTRTDFAAAGERARGAVIGGYEDSATAENTRQILLASLGGPGD